MGARFGGVAGVAAITVALVIALAAALSFGRFDLATGTYTFTEPATDYVDESLVLVHDGYVTDVWISADNRVNEYYGYTPQTPATVLQLGDDTAALTRDGDTLRQCWFVGTEAEHCTMFEQIDRVSAGQARRMSAWSGLEDGSYYFEGISVTWDVGSNYRATVKDGVISAEPTATSLHGIDTSSLPTEDGDWVRYWEHGANEPFAICHDDPRSIDEEECWTWSPATAGEGL